jgi:hypothetical protein
MTLDMAPRAAGASLDPGAEPQATGQTFPLTLDYPDKDNVEEALWEFRAEKKEFWALDPVALFAPGPELKVTRFLKEGRLTVWVVTGHRSAYTTAIVLEKDQAGHPTAQGSVAYAYDAHVVGGPPPRGRLQEVTGYASISSADWDTKQPL